MNQENAGHRIDKFVVPTEMLSSFLEGVDASHREIDRLEGMVRNEVLVQIGGEGSFNVVTHVVWRDEAAYEKAIAEMSRFHDARGGRPTIDPSIEVDLAMYHLSHFGD